MIFSALRTPLRTTTSTLLRRNLNTSVQKSPLLTTNLRHASPLARATPVFVRGVASSVSGRPGSQSVQHAAQNIREEVGNSAADLAKTIAGGNYYKDNVEPQSDTFVRLVHTRVWVWS